MSGSKVEFLKLWQATSGNGNTYYRGRLNGLRLIGFPVEAKGEDSAHIQLYVDTSSDRPAAGQGERRNADSKPARQQGGYGQSYGAAKQRGAAPRRETGGNPPAPFNDEMPFGEWTP